MRKYYSKLFPYSDVSVVEYSSTLCNYEKKSFILRNVIDHILAHGTDTKYFVDTGFDWREKKPIYLCKFIHMVFISEVNRLSILSDKKKINKM